MRTYPSNSPQAAGRLLALTMIVDGNLAPSELDALDHSRILARVDLGEEAFRALLQDLCEDMLAGAANGEIQLAPAVLDSLLAEITDPSLRRRLLHAMWQIADADGWLADGEAVLLARAGVLWGAETGFSTRAPIDSGLQPSL
ncbi:MAG: hypothetical protein JWP59_4127 [Massilia sp.]|nr:hypothetical protein [Massilia sp.]